MSGWRRPGGFVGSGAGSSVPAVGFGSVFVSAVGVQVDPGGGSFGGRDDVVEVAAFGGHGSGRVGADAVSESDGHAEFAGRVAAHFGDVEEVAVLVGEQPGERGAGRVF